MPTLTTIVAADGTWSVPLPLADAGTYAATARQEIGGLVSAPVAFDLIVDAAVPTITGAPAIVTSASLPQIAVTDIETDLLETEVA